MKLQEMTELKERCLTAKTYGRQIANAEAYAAELEAVAGPVALVGVVKNSAAHLLALIEKAERVQAGEAPAKAPEPEAKKPKKSKKKKDADDSSEEEPSDEESEDEQA